MTQETIDVDERLRFDEAALQRYLSKDLPGFAGALSVRKFSYGQSNPTYFLETDAGQKYVLRKKPPGKLIQGAHAVEREFQVMRAVGQAGYEVPKVHVLCEDDSIIGTSFYVMDFTKGRLINNNLQSLSPEDRQPALLAIVKSLAKLHQYDPLKLGLVGGERPFGRTGGFYDRQISTMTRTSESQVSNSDGKIPPLQKMQDLLSLFNANMPEDLSCIIHGDWKPDNMIMSEDEFRVLGVIDWELSTIGHPMSDLANMCLPYHLTEDNPIAYPAFDLRPGSGTPSEVDVHRAYCEAAGLPFPITNWSFYIAFSCFRLAVIVQGVAMRASRGQASANIGDAWMSFVKGADFMCDLAFTIMSKGARESAAPGSAAARL